MIKKGIPVLASLALSASIFTPLTTKVEASGYDSKILTEQTEETLDHSFVSVDKINYEVRVYDNGDSITSSVTSNQGTIEYSRNKETGIYTVSSDFLTEAELIDVQVQANTAIGEGSEEIIDLDSITEAKSNMYTSESIMSLSASSSWKNGSWKNRTITANGKFTVQTVIGVLGSAFGFGGAAVAGAANLMIQYGVKTGYFKVRQDHKILNGSYMLRRQTVKTYKDKKRTKLLGTSTGEQKVWIGI
ncbi:hypothetical protein R3398_03425 [Rossellomorea marisflavi]|uniref:hypothetical protein n=1 Tax=Rossellomorea marisflavi TaxID=189381 RepID=UPI00296F7B60|nr:hypothetical protein [Rossellomorea marisflavi]MDW4525424.1 hypothetical protein [Rossellomorea marisflavi]